MVDEADVIFFFPPSQKTPLTANLRLGLNPACKFYGNQVSLLPFSSEAFPEMSPFPQFLQSITSLQSNHQDENDIHTQTQKCKSSLKATVLDNKDFLPSHI